MKNHELSRQMKAIMLAICSMLVFVCGVKAEKEKDPEQPRQPKGGPGGLASTHATSTACKYDSGDLEYWIFEPADRTPDTAPVVIFLHGWSAINPVVYRGWIDHIVRRGNIVIYPRYQATLETKPYQFAPNAIAAVKNALKKLEQEPNHVRPEPGKLAVVGHSAGGLIAADLTALARKSGLPAVAAVMCVEPGKSWGPKKLQIPLADMSKVPASTLLLAVAGDHDSVVRDVDAKRIYSETVQIPAKNKNFVVLSSDDHGDPPLIANHICPTALQDGVTNQIRASGITNEPNTPDGGDMPVRRIIGERLNRRIIQPGTVQQYRDQPLPKRDHQRVGKVDALDFYGIWKLFDALEEAAFWGRSREYALGNTPQQRFMGKWSDGVPVKEILVR